MSASLVGSEMCIRDSVGSAAAPPALGRGPPSEPPAAASSVAGTSDQGDDGPVSYTHLRAHETSAHL
eukprot:10198388-Alexandrium_andersonii.AAC.1